MAFGVGITDEKLLFCHGISEESEDNKLLTIEYNKMTVYYCFDNIFPDDCGSSYFYLTPIIIDDIPQPHNISWYNPDLIPYNISVASENSVSTFTTPNDSPLLLILTYYYPSPPHAMKKDEP